MIGKTKITEKQKETMRELVNHTCQGCKLSKYLVGKLEIHRITRGNLGGTYAPNNCMVICSKCHRAFHEREEGCGK